MGDNNSLYVFKNVTWASSLLGIQPLLSTCLIVGRVLLKHITSTSVFYPFFPSKSRSGSSSIIR